MCRSLDPQHQRRQKDSRSPKPVGIYVTPGRAKRLGLRLSFRRFCLEGFQRPTVSITLFWCRFDCQNRARSIRYSFKKPLMDELIPTRATLLQRLKNWQDQSSWQDFFDTYWKLLFDVALKSGLSEVEAQDVVQETMIAVAKRMPTFKYDPAIGTFKAWLFKITRWRITDQLRERIPLGKRDRFAHGTAAGTRTMDQIVDPTIPDITALWEAEWEKNLFDAAVAHVKRRFDPQRYQ